NPTALRRARPPLDERFTLGRTCRPRRPAWPRPSALGNGRCRRVDRSRCHAASRRNVPMTTRPISPRRTERGFSLVEAMVSLVVISVGMIGMAALYGQGLGAGRTALYRTIAVNLAA